MNSLPFRKPSVPLTVQALAVSLIRWKLVHLPPMCSWIRWDSKHQREKNVLKCWIVDTLLSKRPSVYTIKGYRLVSSSPFSFWNQFLYTYVGTSLYHTGSDDRQDKTLLSWINSVWKSQEKAQSFFFSSLPFSMQWPQTCWYYRYVFVVSVLLVAQSAYFLIWKFQTIVSSLKIFPSNFW